jgi:hypothetical protein
LVEIDQTRTDVVVPEQTVVPNRLKQKKRIRKPKSNNTSNIETTNNSINNKPENNEGNSPIKNELPFNSEQPQSLP